MQVKIITNKSNVKYDVETVQKNKNPTKYIPFCEYNDKLNIILVTVPSCVSNVSSQIGFWKELVNVYVSVINKAIIMNKKSILIPELGENLLWKEHLIVKAAKESLNNCNSCDDDFMVIFYIKEDQYKLWDKIMVF